MPYKANKGGYAPGHLREAFLDYLGVGPNDFDGFEGYPNRDTVVVGDEQEKKPLRWLLGQLWNCTDVMPSEACEVLNLVPGSTYAQGVRKVAWGEF